MDDKTQTVSVEEAKSYLRANQHNIFSSKTVDLIENETFLKVTQFLLGSHSQYGRDVPEVFLMLLAD